MARKKKSTNEEKKTLTAWGFKYIFDSKSGKWMEGRKEVNPLVSVMLDELYSKYEKTSTPPQDTEEAEILLSPIPREEDKISEEVKEDAKREREEAEQKIKSPGSEKLEIIKPNIEVDLIKPPEDLSRDRRERKLPRLESSIAPDALKERVKDITISPLTKRESSESQDRTLSLFSNILEKMQKSGTSSAGSDLFKGAIENLNKTLGIFVAKQKEEKSEIIKPNIEIESLINPVDISSRDKSELSKFKDPIISESYREKIKEVPISPQVKRKTQETPRQDQTLSLFSDILEKMQKSGSSSAGSDMFKEAISNLNRTLGIFAAKQKEERSTSSVSKTDRGFEGIVNTEKSSVYLKSIDERIAEILSFLKLEEREEDTQETEVKAEAVKRKLEESYKATGAEIADSVNQSIAIPKGFLDTRLGKQFDTNLARRLDEELPLLNLFTDKLQQMKESSNQESAPGGTVILGGALGGIGAAIKGGAKSIYSAGSGVMKGLGKAATSIGTSLSGIGKNIFKGAGPIGSGLLKKARGAGSVLAAGAKTATKNLSSFGKSIGLGTVSLASGAMGAMTNSAKTASSMTKGLGKSVLKKIPGVSIAAGLGFGAGRLLSGDFTGAAMEVGSGLAGTIPGIGTAASVGIDAALMARDEGMFDSNELQSSDTEELTPAAQQQKSKITNQTAASIGLNPGLITKDESTFTPNQFENPNIKETLPTAQQQKPKITNQTAALREFETQRKMIQDKRNPSGSNTTTIINNNKTEKSRGGGATGILSTAGATRSLYLHYYAA